jgi:hypothetical protein
MALFLPWFVFLFVGAFDWGFYAHALISTQSAARVAVLYTSQSTSTASDSTSACKYALEELRIAANVGSTVTTCGASPVIVTATQVTGPDGNQASQVSVQYTTPSLIPIPGLLTNQATFYRVVQMTIRG